MGANANSLWHANWAMRQAFPDFALIDVTVQLPLSMTNIIQQGLVEVGGCVLQKELLAKAHTPRGYFPDATGYECFVNHLHLDDHACHDLVRIGASFLHAICDQLGERFPEKQFRAIMGGGGENWDVRFHTLRLGEVWLLEDLDSYDECLCVVEVNTRDFGNSGTA